MNFNLKSMAFVFFALFAVNTISAQRGGGQDLTAEQRAEKKTERMTEQLSLTSAQTQQVAALNLKYAQQKENLKAKSVDKADSKAVKEQMRSEQETELKSILTPEQLEKYNTSAKQKHGGAKGKKMSNGERGNNRSPEERAEMQTKRLTEHLSLDDTQSARIQTIIWESEKEIETAKSDEAFNKSDMKLLHEERDATIKAVLTPEQVTKFEKRKKGGKRGDKRS